MAEAGRTSRTPGGRGECYLVWNTHVGDGETTGVGGRCTVGREDSWLLVVGTERETSRVGDESFMNACWNDEKNLVRDDDERNDLRQKCEGTRSPGNKWSRWTPGHPTTWSPGAYEDEEMKATVILLLWCHVVLQTEGEGTSTTHRS